MEVFVRIFLDDTCTTTILVKKPKTKKKRIVKKWMKKQGHTKTIPNEEKIVKLFRDEKGFYVVTHPINKPMFDEAVGHGVLNGEFISMPRREYEDRVLCRPARRITPTRMQKRRLRKNSF